MDEEFVTTGLQSNRYLKAEKLVYEFQSEVTSAMDEVCEQIIDDHPELFNEDVTRQERDFGAGSGNTLATIRTEMAMNRQNDAGNTPKLNIGIEWVEPDQQGEDGYDGSLCYVLYKIQHGTEARFEKVRDRTESTDGWDELRFGEDQWYHPSKYAPGIVYIPVENGSDVVTGLETLREHFSKIYAPTY